MMSYQMSLRTIIRLYNTVPLKEKIISRTPEFVENVHSLIHITDMDMLAGRLSWLYENNKWRMMPVLPDWLTKKHNITEEELTYLGILDKTLKIELGLFNEGVIKHLQSTGEREALARRMDKLLILNAEYLEMRDVPRMTVQDEYGRTER